MSSTIADVPSPDTETPEQEKPLPPTVRALGFVSLFTDLSSEMVYPVNAIFLTQVLGAPPAAVGLIEGVAESTASIIKLYSGVLSDRMGVRKPLTLWGYGLAAFSKPLIAIATIWPHVLGARFLDRFGKGLRATPRDALITEVTPKSQRGRAFGLHRSMDTTGAVLGPLLGFLFLSRFPHGMRSLYLLAFLPGLLGVLTLLFFVRETKRRGSAVDAAPRPAPPPLREILRGLSPEYRRYLLSVAIFGLGNSSDAFLLLRAQSMGIAPKYLLLLYALFNVIEASLGYLAGKLSDRIGRRPLIALGFIVFALVYLGFGLLSGPIAASALFIAYGMYYTLTQGTQKAQAADLTHEDRRGAELGVFHLLVGVAALPASLCAGWLYGKSPAAPFLLGAVTATIAAIALLVAASRSKR